jgi:imidazole glycerol-phosphate synthase
LEWVLSLTDYGGQRYISMVQRGNVIAAQFHPEKSGSVGLHMIQNFLALHGNVNEGRSQLFDMKALDSFTASKLAKRVIACLDVRSNDDGDLVVTKGDQYDVREASSDPNCRYSFCNYIILVANST